MGQTRLPSPAESRLTAALMERGRSLVVCKPEVPPLPYLRALEVSAWPARRKNKDTVQRTRQQCRGLMLGSVPGRPESSSRPDHVGGRGGAGQGVSLA